MVHRTHRWHTQPAQDLPGDGVALGYVNCNIRELGQCIRHARVADRAGAETVVADLADLHALQERECRLARSPYDLLVSAAGLAHHHPFVEADPDLAFRALAARFARPGLQLSGDASS